MTITYDGVSTSNNSALAFIGSLLDWGTPEAPRTPTEADKWSIVRKVRDHLLAQCDWTQLPDTILTLTEKHAWQDYRQTLRDIPQDFSIPEEVIFPTPPGGA